MAKTKMVGNTANKKEWYGVRPDGFHHDGCPVFHVDNDDYYSAVKREPGQRLKFKDNRINTAIKNSRYTARSMWLVNKNNGRKYKWITPRKQKPKDATKK